MIGVVPCKESENYLLFVVVSSEKTKFKNSFNIYVIYNIYHDVNSYKIYP